MNIMNTVRLVAQSTVLYMKRASIRRNLMSFSDVMLDDIGVSRELLEQGVKAYPWLMKIKSNVDTPSINTLVSLNSYDKVLDTTTMAANDLQEHAKAYAKSFAQAA